VFGALRGIAEAPVGTALILDNQDAVGAGHGREANIYTHIVVVGHDLAEKLVGSLEPFRQHKIHRDSPRLSSARGHGGHAEFECTQAQFRTGWKDRWRSAAAVVP